MQLLRKDRPLTPSWDLVQPSTRLLRENIWPIFYLSFLPSLIITVGVVLMGSPIDAKGYVHFDNRALTGLAVAFIGGIISLLTYPGMIYLMTRIVRGEHPTGGESFRNGLRRLIPFIIMSLFESILIVSGFFLFIIPGLILLRGFFLAPYYIIDQKLSPGEALKRSYEESKPNAGYIWGTIGVLISFSMLGYLFGRIPVVGYLLSLAISYFYVLAPAIRYAEITDTLKVELAVPKIEAN